ncbi:MAG: hypothetical protein L0287_37275 [Anaerolineae bacterium]|nr:hypothetical protein [Anaerolineae bacterium]
MKEATSGTISGCLVWVIAFFAISLCVLPISMAVGGITSITDFAIQQTGAIVCPDNTTPEVRSFATYGSGPSTTYVLECVDASGNVVKEDPVGYAFLWIGIVTVVGLILTGVLAFVFAAPAGALVAGLVNRMKKK